MLSRSRFTEKSVERVVASSDRLVRRHLPIRLDPVLQTEQLPAGVANLHSRLTDVDRDALPHDGESDGGGGGTGRFQVESSRDGEAMCCLRILVLVLVLVLVLRSGCC